MAQTTSVSNDVLHAHTQTKLSAEEIAKAVQRHNRNHPNRQAQSNVKLNNARKPR